MLLFLFPVPFLTWSNFTVQCFCIFLGKKCVAWSTRHAHRSIFLSSFNLSLTSVFFHHSSRRSWNCCGDFSLDFLILFLWCVFYFWRVWWVGQDTLLGRVSALGNFLPVLWWSQPNISVWCLFSLGFCSFFVSLFSPFSLFPRETILLVLHVEQISHLFWKNRWVEEACGKNANWEQDSYHQKVQSDLS